MAEAAQVVGGTQSGRSRTDHEHLLSGVNAGRGERPLTLDSEIAEKAFDGVDPYRLIDLSAIARALARVIADASHYGREWIVLHELAPRALVVAGFGVVEPLLDVLAGRARVVARGKSIDVHGPFDAPRSGVVRVTRTDFERYREGKFGHDVAPLVAANCSTSPISPYRSMFASAIAWIWATMSGRPCSPKRCPKRRWIER